MLDAYIIDQLRRERAERARREQQLPLHIEPEPVGRMERRPEPDRTPERGSVQVDYRV
jgi:hypothetical protein